MLFHYVLFGGRMAQEELFNLLNKYSNGRVLDSADQERIEAMPHLFYTFQDGDKKTVTLTQEGYIMLEKEGQYLDFIRTMDSEAAL
jgi:hypothetical protein